MNDRPAVTAIVPFYDGGGVVLEAVRSLLDQSYPDVRVLVVDDGSVREDLRTLLAPVADRVRIELEPHRGLSATLNHAIAELVDTPLVARLDQDDFAEPERIGAQVDLLERTGADVCLARYWRVGADGRPRSVHPQFDEPHHTYDPIRYGQIVHSTLLARTEVLRRVGGYRTEYYPADDYDLSIRLHESATVVVHGTPLVRYRVHDAAASMLTFHRMAAIGRYLDLRAKHGPESLPPLDTWLDEHPPDRRQRRRDRGRYHFRRAGAALGDRRRVSGAGHLMAAAFLDPRFVRERLGATVRVPAPTPTSRR